MRFTLGSGPSRSIRYPDSGPSDLQRGYSMLPTLLDRLDDKGYSIQEQARDSSTSLMLAHLGVYPIYREKDQAGLDIVDRQGANLFSFRDPQRTYPDFTSIPTLVVQTLLFIENRHMLDEHTPNRNPAIEWERLARAGIDFGLNKVNRHHPVSGGSTLATQLEKLRHSPEGRTHTPAEKLRQIASATLRSYQDGPRTLETQRVIIRDYINSIRLSASPGHGEVTGLGDGLATWYDADFGEVNRLLASTENSLSPQQMEKRAHAYRQVLSLLLALRRPSVYLLQNPQALATETDRYLRALCTAGVISRPLRDAALRERISLKPVPPVQAKNYVANKAANAARGQMLGLLGLQKTYVLDRLDLDVQTTIDQKVQQSVTQFFEQLANPQNARSAGLDEANLLSTGDPSHVIYSFTLYERGNGVNLLRAQTDNFNQPLSIVEGTRLQLGSTAKLRTLINYLEIIEELHRQYGELTSAQLATQPVSPGDVLSQWALAYLATAHDRSREAMLTAALDRQYSGSPAEVFFTAGGRHVFANFERSENSRVMTVREGFEQSVNLVFIRLMRDIEGYYKWRVPGASPTVLTDPNDPARERYLKRFADKEGSVFLGRFYAKYRGLDANQALETLMKSVRPTPVRGAVIFRSARPSADFTAFSNFMNRHVPAAGLRGNHTLEKLYANYAPGKFNLSDCGYLASIHPLELWLTGYLQQHPQASLAEAIAHSAQERQEVYRWLFRAKERHGQDLRIGILLEEDAFHEIWKAWKRVGYPFDSLVPSYATSIGVSGDTPKALAELAGILANGGIRYPVEFIHQMTFARSTPMETTVAFHPAVGEKVLSPSVAALVYESMLGVVRNGTGRRALRAFVLPDGEPLPIAGKTGTGDNRFKVFTMGSGVIAEHPVNRTAAFVFIVDDRLFGTVMAFVPSQHASSYKFTSALAVQILKDLAPRMQPLLSDQQKTP